MSTIVSILLTLLLVLAVILVGIQVQNMFNKQANLIVELQHRTAESFTTPNHAWNMAASYTNRYNNLLTTAQNKVYKQDKPGYLPSNNGNRNVLPMNNIASTKQQMRLPDANTLTGWRNEVTGNGRKNPSVIPDDARRKIEAAIKANKVPTYLMDGIDTKIPKAVYDDNAPIDRQRNGISMDDPSLPFSTNSRVNASGAAVLVPSESKASNVLQSIKQ